MCVRKREQNTLGLGVTTKMWSKAKHTKITIWFMLIISPLRESGKWMARLRIFNLFILHLKNWNQMVFRRSEGEVEWNLVSSKCDIRLLFVFPTKKIQSLSSTNSIKTPSVCVWSLRVANTHNRNDLIYRFRIGNKPYSNGTSNFRIQRQKPAEKFKLENSIWMS